MIDSMDGPSCLYPPTDNEHYLVKDYKDVEKKIILEINLRWINILIKNSKVVWSIHMYMMIDILAKIKLVMRDFIKNYCFNKKSTPSVADRTPSESISWDLTIYTHRSLMTKIYDQNQKL